MASSSSARPAPARTTFAADAYPHWVPELDRAVELGTAFAARDAHGRTIGFGVPLREPRGMDRADGNRSGAAARRRRLGRARRAAAPTSKRAACATGEIAWVSNLRFYGKCGARVSRVFLGGRKHLSP